MSDVPNNKTNIMGETILDDSYYQGLVRFTEVYAHTLQEINLQAINLTKSNGFIQAMKDIQRVTEAITPCYYKTMLSVADALQQVKSKIDLNTLQIAQSLQSIALKYQELFGSYDLVSMSESMRIMLERSQLTSIMQLCVSHETKMVHDAISCFANAKYEYLPSVFNQTMKKHIIGAADIAFLKTGTIIPIIESELVYPRGIKQTLKLLNKSTAENIADNGCIDYNTNNHKFITSNASEDSQSLNIICAGKEILDSNEDLFTEVELMDFVSYLSCTPMLGLLESTGIRIFNWLKKMFDQKSNIIGFDRSVYYHCRMRNKNEMPYTYEQMLKAPYGLSEAGRFNQAGRSHFYYASTQKGAEVEVKKHLKNGQVLQVVKLKPVKTIKMLDLSGTLQRGTAFLRMIRYPLDDSNKMPRQYLLPCFVADCCQKIGFDGIKYYGSKEYDNYVSWSDNYFEYAGMCKLH